MAHEIDLDKYQIRTDLLIETIESAKEKAVDLPVTKETHDDITVTIVDIEKKHESILNKKLGRYITIEYDDISDHHNKEKVANVFKQQLQSLLSYINIGEKATCMVIGLGNEKSTPDALGPTAIQNILVTKHLFDLEGNVESGFREVSAFSPGVMGSTGLETSKIVVGVVKAIKPDFLLIIDALAAQSIARVNKTIQMTNTGINPGSGIGNKREEISLDTVGIPVIAIGIPTVVDAVTIVSETINFMFKHISYQKRNLDRPINKLIAPGTENYLAKNNNEDLDKVEKTNLLGIVGNLTDEEIKQLIYEVLTPIGYNLMVTPKEIDFVIANLSEVLAEGINGALHQKIS